MSVLDRRHPSYRAHPSAETDPNPVVHSASRFTDIRPRAYLANEGNSTSAVRKPLSPVNTFALNDSLQKLSLSQHPHPSKSSVDRLKPLPSVPTDVNADDSFDDAGVELVYPLHSGHHCDNDNHIESDISSASASSTASSSSMEPDWHETSLRRQVAKLQVQYSDLDLAQTEAPSVFGLRRRIIAAALDHAAQRQQGDDASSSSAQFEDKGLAEWLAIQHTSSQWKGKSIRKKLSFGKKQARAAMASQSTVHDPMPNDAASTSTSSSRTRCISTTASTSSHDKTLRRDKELAECEANFDLVVLSRFESASLKMTIYTEQRQGSWVIKGPAPPRSHVLDEPPLVYSPWDCQIDSAAIVERKKLRSYVELSDTTCFVRCSTCNSPQHQQLGKRPDGFRITPGATVGCKQCQGSGAVQTNYVVCVTLRQSNFLPLAMPVRHLAGKAQNAFRAYLPQTTKAMSHVDLLRMRSIEAVRSCALRVGRAHHKEHDARLLLAQAVLERRTCNSVAVINRFNGLFRVFDITDGGCIRGGAGLIEEESRIVESPELGDALARLPITIAIPPHGSFRFIDLELVDMATSKELTMMAPSRSPSVYTDSSDGSYSPSAFSFFQRSKDPGRYGGDASRDENLTRGLTPPPERASTHSSLALPNRPWATGRNTPSTRSTVSGRTMQTWETAPERNSGSARSGSTRSSGTIPANI